MSGNRLFVFSPFSLDTANERLLRGSKKVPLRPKSFALLRYFLEHPSQLLTKTELMQAGWAATNVVESALKVSIWEIRRALEDEADAPKFVETMGHKGYRFIAPVIYQFCQNPSPRHEPLLLMTPILLAGQMICSNWRNG